jgi:hypothetical protein
MLAAQFSKNPSRTGRPRLGDDALLYHLFAKKSSKKRCERAIHFKNAQISRTTTIQNKKQPRIARKTEPSMMDLVLVNSRLPCGYF